MSDVLRPSVNGLNYQGAIFWLKACSLFDSRSKVSTVELESDEIKSLDDVVLFYNPMLNDRGVSISAEYFQVKWSERPDKSITWQSLADPSLINAEKLSLLQRISDGALKLESEGKHGLFHLYAPWCIQYDNEIVQLIDNSDGRLRVDLLMSMGKRSKIGKVREAWRAHLGGLDDEELKVVASSIRISQGLTLKLLNSIVSTALVNASLEPIDNEKRVNQYQALFESFVTQGPKKFTKDSLLDICKQEGLWTDPSVKEETKTIIGIRSFYRFAERIENQVDLFLDLLPFFDGRFIKEDNSWEQIYKSLDDFLTKNTQPSESYVLHLPTHGSLGFAVGQWFCPKSGRKAFPVQSTLSGQTTWDPAVDLPNEASVWNVNEIELSDSTGDVVVVISISHDIIQVVRSYVESSVKEANNILHFSTSKTGQDAILNGSHAFKLAEELISRLEQVRSSMPSPRTIHFFWSAPIAFLFFLGQRALSLGSVQLYEHDFENTRTGWYEPSLKLPVRT